MTNNASQGRPTKKQHMKDYTEQYTVNARLLNTIDGLSIMCSKSPKMVMNLNAVDLSIGTSKCMHYHNVIYNTCDMTCHDTIL